MKKFFDFLDLFFSTLHKTHRSPIRPRISLSFHSLPTVDPGYDPSIGDEPAIEDSDAPTPPSLDDPEDPQDTTPSTTTVDASSLTLKTNVGSLNKDAGTGKYDCTIKTSESVRLILQGTDAQVTWSSGDESVVTVASDGTLKPLKVGMTTVTAKVGNAAVECIIRVKG